MSLTEADANRTAAQHIGQLAVPTIILSTVVLIAFVATLAGFVTGVLPFWVAGIVVGLLTYAAYTPLHDAVHAAVSGSRSRNAWLNTSVGVAMGLVMGMPFISHRTVHLSHHQNTNDPDQDPDFGYSKATNPLKLLLLAPTAIADQFTYYMRKHWGVDRKRDLAFVAEVVVSLAVRVGVLAASGLWLEGFGLFLIGALVGFMILIYLFAYIVHQPYEAVGRFVDTGIYDSGDSFRGRLVTWLWGYQNYHAIHHLYPRIPFYRYVDVFREIEPLMREKGAPIVTLGGNSRIASAS